ncbi:HU family DNA-binding protein [Tateyamaria pelophila]|uniref:HU family DNA-binding protein n=1 Tax=Tateyamaria pelophila TaxID=328415 RepID=UPI001CBF03E9|nr:HU family DNA-binding protein [Tateyamaria pelophila]
MATTKKTTRTSTRKTPSTGETAVTKAKATGAKPVSPEPAPSVVVNAPQPVVAGPMMRKKELINAVVAKSGIKKKDAKPVIEAMLEVLGSALQDGRELNLQPLGKVKVNREKKLAVGKVLITRIRQARDLPPSVVADDPDTASQGNMSPSAD